jgi:transmembrane sensor
MTERETADEIEETASRWVCRLAEEGRDAAADAELQAWLAGDPRRQGAFLQAEAVWTLLGRAQWYEKYQQPTAARAMRPGTPRRALLLGGGAAMAASVAGVCVLLPPGERIQTKIGEIRHVPLSDGSTAAVNTASSLEVVLKPQRRIIKLNDGEAWFEVAKDAQRPFIVEAGRVRVQAVGTAFSVRRRSNGADVLVTEGVVEAWAEGAEGASIRIAAGDKAFVADDAAVHEAVAAPSEIDRKLAWRDGKIDLAGETLGEAAAEFNRYNERKIIVADPRLAAEPLFGIFRSDDPISFANAIKVSLGAPVSTTTEQILIG